MALFQPQTAQGFAALPALRQLGLMVGLAASVAIGVAVVLWSQEPNYSLLYGSLDNADSSRVMEELQKSNIPYKLDEASGAVMVAAGEVHKARLKLAAQGLPKGSGVGFELLEKEQELGASQFLEHARYQHSIEIELARSISSMRDVESARVHLAIPKRTGFLRKQEKPSASVVLNLYAGRTLSDEQVASVVHLVASSVPGLPAESVTVVDQMGTLLTRGNQDKGMAMTSSQFEYTRRLEDNFKKRIEDLISPIVGPGRVRAQVVADVDFTVTENTHESYNPDLPALRSEQVTEDSASSGGAAAGIPGALSNQPPAGGTLGVVETGAGGAGGSNSRRVIRNYELDRTISHTRSPSSTVRRLSVAVLVDDLQTVNDAGVTERTPLSQEQLDRVTSLVKEAVGFEAKRGDTINVNNVSFYIPAPPEPLPEQAIYEQAWVQDVMKQALGGVVVLILIFGVLKPVLRSLTEKGESLPSTQYMMPGGDQQALPAGMQQGQLGAPQGVQSMEGQLAAAKTMAAQDPGRVAQVVKGWVASDG